MQDNKHNYIYYGTEANASEVMAFVQHIFQTNQEGSHKSPICIWGRHGIGKTEIVAEIAQRNGYEFAYIAPAQFEEMGDLVGMPIIENGVTSFKAPAWVPTSEKPGILLIDDVNRADDRILRGIMQLLQNYELVSWKLPTQWQIVLTANPDGGDYSVTPMDDAMLTRMMHITLSFDVKEWAKWAEANDIDERGIHFVLTYPESINGERTTPRTLVHFFESIKSIKDLKKKRKLVKLLADSTLDKHTAIAFLAFVDQNLSALPTPLEILGAKDFATSIKHSIVEMTQEEVIRVDILATLCTRMVNYLNQQSKKLNAAQLSNLQAFVLLDCLPNDLRLAMAQDIMDGNNQSAKAIFSEPAIGALLLG